MKYFIPLIAGVTLLSVVSSELLQGSAIGVRNTAKYHKTYEKQYKETYITYYYNSPRYTVYYQNMKSNEIVMTSSCINCDWTQDVEIKILKGNFPIFAVNSSQATSQATLFNNLKNYQFMGTNDGDVIASLDGINFNVVCKACSQRKKYEGVSTLYSKANQKWISANAKGQVYLSSDLQTWTLGSIGRASTTDKTLVLKELVIVTIPDEHLAALYLTRSGIVEYYFTKLNQTKLDLKSGPYTLMHIVEAEDLAVGYSPGKSETTLIASAKNRYFKSADLTWNAFFILPRTVTVSNMHKTYRLRTDIATALYFSISGGSFTVTAGPLGVTGTGRDWINTVNSNGKMIMTYFEGDSKNVAHVFNKNSADGKGVRAGFNKVTNVMYVDRTGAKHFENAKLYKCKHPYQGYYESPVELPQDEEDSSSELYSIHDGPIVEQMYAEIYSLVFLLFSVDDSNGFDIYSDQDKVQVNVEVSSRKSIPA